MEVRSSCRTTRHIRDAISQHRRKLIEQVFLWKKTIGLTRKYSIAQEFGDWVVKFHLGYTR